MRWACIVLPHLALDGVLRRRADPQAPLALIAGPSRRRVLYAVNPAARTLGLAPGMPLPTAQALAQGFACIEHDPAETVCWQRLLAAWAYGFSSLVSLHGSHALVLEVEGSHGLFGPWPVFEARLRAELLALGFRHRIAAAPNPAAARALAGVRDGLAVAGDAAMRRALEQLPVERAGFGPATAAAFARMGLRRLGQVLALPRESVARRFPPEVLQHLDTLLGERAPPLAWYRPPDRFDARIELGYEVESSQALLFPLKRLTSDLAAFLAGRDGGVQRFVLRLEHEGAADTEVPVGLLAAERDAGLLFELARGRLERAAVPAPVRAIRLRAAQLPPFVPAHRELFDPHPQQGMPWERLRERLRARLGERAVHGLRLRADHRPEHAWQPDDADTAAAGHRATSRPVAAQADPPPSPTLLPRPGWLLSSPLPLRGRSPRILAGPERIETGWWDGGDVRRDYYQVEIRTGQRAWVYRPVGEGGAGDEAARATPGGFLLHGWFA